MKSYQQVSDRIYCEYLKTFRAKDKKAPRFSFVMRLVKKFGEEEVVKKLGYLRENRNFNKITDFHKYLRSLFTQ